MKESLLWFVHVRSVASHDPTKLNIRHVWAYVWAQKIPKVMDSLTDDEVRGAVHEIVDTDESSPVWTIMADVLDHKPLVQNELLDAIEFN